MATSHSELRLEDIKLDDDTTALESFLEENESAECGQCDASREEVQQPNKYTEEHPDLTTPS